MQKKLYNLFKYFVNIFLISQREYLINMLIFRSLSSASSKLQSNNNVPIRTNPRASASNLPDAGNIYLIVAQLLYNKGTSCISLTKHLFIYTERAHAIPIDLQYFPKSLLSVLLNKNINNLKLLLFNKEGTLGLYSKFYKHVFLFVG